MRFTDSGGDGEVLVLLHAGVFADWFVPLVNQPALADLRRIRVIRTGYAGDSPATPLSVADHSRECANLLQTVGVDRAHVLAHSSGAVFALQLALDYPDLVTDLILCEPPLIEPLAPQEDHAAIRTVVGPVIGAAMAAALRGDLPGAFDIFMTAMCGPEYPAVITATLGSAGLQQARADCGYFFTGEMPALGQWHFDDELAHRIHQPVHLIGGHDSPPFTHHLITHLAKTLPHTDTTIMSGQNHLLPLQAPAGLANLIATITTEPDLMSA
jgi:pimeloyl-ACP methyl ester carboxylesterase